VRLTPGGEGRERREGRERKYGRERGRMGGVWNGEGQLGRGGRK